MSISQLGPNVTMSFKKHKCPFFEHGNLVDMLCSLDSKIGNYQKPSSSDNGNQTKVARNFDTYYYYSGMTAKEFL